MRKKKRRFGGGGVPMVVTTFFAPPTRAAAGLRVSYEGHFFYNGTIYWGTSVSGPIWENSKQLN